MGAINLARHYQGLYWGALTGPVPSLGNCSPTRGHMAILQLMRGTAGIGFFALTGACLFLGDPPQIGCFRFGVPLKQ